MEPSAVLVLLYLLVALKAGFIGMSLMIQHRFSSFIGRASGHYQDGTRKWVFFVGLFNGIAIPFVALLLISSGVLALLGLLLLLIYLWLALMSYAVVYREIGATLFEVTETNRELKRTLYGGLVAEAAFFTPVLGQLFSLTLFVRGLGAIVITLLSRKRGSE